MVHFWIMDRKSWTQGQTVLWLYNKHVMLSTPGGNRRYSYYKDIFVKNGNAHVNFTLSNTNNEFHSLFTESELTDYILLFAPMTLIVGHRYSSFNAPGSLIHSILLTDKFTIVLHMKSEAAQRLTRKKNSHIKHFKLVHGFLCNALVSPPQSLES